MVWYLDPAFLTALGTWSLVVGTLALMYRQNQQTRELNSATSVMDLRERFDAPHLRRARKQLATRLLNDQHDDITNLEVGAFFELLATLTHRRVLEDELIWEAFGTWVSGYYYSLRHPVDLIGRGRAELQDPLIFGEFEWLAGEVDRMDRGRGSVETPESRAREAKALLRREADLDIG